MFAIIKTGGKQYKVQVGDVLNVEKLEISEGSEVTFDCLMLSNDDGVTVGSPLVDGANVRAKVLEHGKAKKIVVFKYKAKKNIRKKYGHRQPYTRVEILGF